MADRAQTTAERLTKIETILDRLEPKLDHLIDEVAADKADLAALKNRGAGILIGIGVLAGVVGAKAQAIIHAVALALAR